MKETDLIDLGFKKEFGENKEFYYYTLQIGTDYTPFCLISNANDETIDEDWCVSVFDYSSFKFTETKIVSDLITILKNSTNATLTTSY